MEVVPLVAVLLLRKARGVGKFGKDELSRRFDKFSEGKWRTLLEEARRAVQMDCPRVATSMTPERRAQAACQKVRLGEVSRTRQCLTRERGHFPRIAGQAPSTSSQAVDTGRVGVRATGPSGIGQSRVLDQFEKSSPGIFVWTWRVQALESVA